MIYIGIDTGVNTGIAIIKDGTIQLIDTIKMHEALFLINNIKDKSNVYVYVEDARLRKWFGANSGARQQGAGSVKRDAKIWEDFLTDAGIKFELVNPMNNTTKMDKTLFNKITGYNKPTSNHSRDAFMLIFKHFKK